MHPSADSHYLGVIVFPGQPSRLSAPRQCGPAANDLIGGDLLAIARPADHHTKASRVRYHPAGGRDAERRVVIVGIVDIGADVYDIVAETGEVLHQKGLELEASVIGTEIDMHSVQHCHMADDRLLRHCDCGEERS